MTEPKASRRAWVSLDDALRVTEHYDVDEGRFKFEPGDYLEVGSSRRGDLDSIRVASLVHQLPFRPSWPFRIHCPTTAPFGCPMSARV
jgi:hypothetical protein